MRVLVLAHEADDGADALGDQLVARGLELVVVSVDREPIPDLAGFDALVVLGGEMNVWQEDLHPWLVAEKSALRAWVAGPPRPLLGICLGHQLLADALGGEVGPRASFEAGIRTVRLTAAGAEDAVVGRLGATFLSVQWHGAEVRRMPVGAVLLASNDSCLVQAMRVGPSAWGVQFHPEVGRAQAERWGRSPMFACLLDIQDGPGGADRFGGVLEAAAAELATITAAFADALVDQVRRRAPAVDEVRRRAAAGEGVEPSDVEVAVDPQ